MRFPKWGLQLPSYLLHDWSSLLKPTQGPRARYYYSVPTLSQEFQSMAAPLSMKAAPHWLKFLRQRHVGIVIQGPGTFINSIHFSMLYNFLLLLIRYKLYSTSGWLHFLFFMSFFRKMSTFVWFVCCCQIVFSERWVNILYFLYQGPLLL